MSSGHITWGEIETSYPNQWIGLNGVKFEPDGITITAASSVTQGDMDDLMDAYAEGRFDRVLYTTPDSFPQCWLFQPENYDSAV